MSPFHIEGPAVISFSGGRTSAYMLRRILDEGLQPDVHVLYANTGRERTETLDFIREIETRWAVPVRWLERDMGSEYGCAPFKWRLVNFLTASRHARPFNELIRDRKGIPNPLARFCTQELKIRVMRDYMRDQDYEHWTNVVGIRADEPRRIAKMRAPNRERWDIALPLADAGVSERDVMEFWARQPFDLKLRPYEGNCDLCFLKTPHKRQLIMRERPDLATWWIEQETAVGSTFRIDTPDYATLLQQVNEQPRLGSMDDQDLTDCYCTD